MQYQLKSRPKMARNKYGLGGVNNTYSGGIIEGQGEFNPSTPTPTTPSTTVVNNIYEGEWYNLQMNVMNTRDTIIDKSLFVDPDATYPVIKSQYVDKELEYYDKSTGYRISASEALSRYSSSTDEIKDSVKIRSLHFFHRFITVIENYDKSKDLGNTEKYRFVLMRLRKGKHQGRRWRIPMFSSVFDKGVTYEDEDGNPIIMKMSIAERDTWWKIEGSETPMWNSRFPQVGSDGYFNLPDGYPLRSDEINNDIIKKHIHHDGRDFCYLDILPLEKCIRRDDNGNIISYKWKNTRNRKMEFGCAIFKNTGRGAHGWQRISNIATLTLYALDGEEEIILVDKETGLPKRYSNGENMTRTISKHLIEANTPTN